VWCGVDHARLSLCGTIPASSGWGNVSGDFSVELGGWMKKTPVLVGGWGVPVLLDSGGFESGDEFSQGFGIARELGGGGRCFAGSAGGVVSGG
jgi:hypothetical protein